MTQIILNGLTKDEFGEIIFQSLAKAINSKASEKKPTISEDVFLTRKEVAQFLKISLPTLHEWSKSGLLISHRIGRRILYKLDEVKVAIEKRQFNKFSNGRRHE